MKFDEFIKKYEGTGVDYDGYLGNQCMDLYHQYCVEVLKSEHPPASGAYKLWDYRYDDYTKIPNTPDAIPSKGDIMLWNSSAGGGWGHVAIFIEGDVGRFTSFDQNWPTGSLCHKQGHYYKNVAGWLHPKGESMSTYKGLDLKNEESMKIAVDTWDDVVNKKLYIKAEDYDKLEETTKIRIKAEEDRFDKFVEDIVKITGSSKDVPKILEDIAGLVKAEDVERSGEIEVKHPGHSKICKLLSKIGL